MDEATPEPERWLPVVGWDGLYEISTLGRVRSLPRKGGRNRWYGGGLLKPSIDVEGYPAVHLSRGGVGYAYRVHVLITAAFIGPRPKGHDVRHLDGQRANSVLSNLTYGTRSENALDTTRHGRNRNAAKTHCDHGHEFTPENTYVGPNGGRSCRRCDMLTTWKRRGKEPDSPRKPMPRRSHCKRGHKFTPENTYPRPDGRGRNCLACVRIRTARKSVARRSAAA